MQAQAINSFPENNAASEFSRLALDHLQPNPYQPRTYFDEAELSGLAESIKTQGVIQPILVRPTAENRFEIVAGERRWRASRLAGLTTIPAYIREMTDQEVKIAALVENTQREDMSETEEAAAAYELVKELGGNLEETAARLGWTMTKLRRRLALMASIAEVRQALNERKILVGHAELLATMPKDKQPLALKNIIERGMTVAEVRAGLQKLSQNLGAAIFDKQGCNGCPHNSSNQTQLFAAAIEDGHCTNPSCYSSKTDEALELKKVELGETYHLVRVVRQPDEESGFVRLHTDGPLGVGAEQASTCQTCPKFGATVSGMLGSLGDVEEGVCFDLECHKKKVASRLQAEKATKASQQEKVKPVNRMTASAASGPAVPTKPAAEKQATRVHLGPQLREYRRKIWNLTLNKSIVADPAFTGRIVVAALALDNNLSFSATKLKETAIKLGLDEARLGKLPSMVAVIAGAGNDVIDKLIASLAITAVSSVPESVVRDLLVFAGAQVTDHWVINRDFFKLLTKPEIELVCREIGLTAHIGDEAFKKAMADKKDALLDAVTSAEGFAYKGCLPAIMNPVTTDL